MPNIKSAKKRMRSNAKKSDVNTLITSSMKTAIKKFEKEVKAVVDAANGVLVKVIIETCYLTDGVATVKYSLDVTDKDVFVNV